MPESPAAGRRLCPICSVATEAETCPEHGVATVLVGHFTKDALSYRKGDTVAGRYRITGALGRGGFGAVFAAEHMGTGQAVALKMLSVDPGSVADDVVARFYREARITARLTDPHTVHMFDVGQAEGGPLYLVMELLRGPTLDKVLRRLDAAGRTMGARQIADLGSQMLKSLAEAHAAGLVHRDLKPANVILAQMGAEETVVKVLDFGIARTQDSQLTATGKTVGTPHYMSPEQFTGAPLDGRSDLYSLGVLLYRCAAGRMPFEGDNPYQLMHAHIHKLPDDPRERAQRSLPDALVEVILRALAKDPDDRFADAKTMRMALQAAAGVAREETPARPADLLKPERGAEALAAVGQGREFLGDDNGEPAPTTFSAREGGGTLTTPLSGPRSLNDIAAGAWDEDSFEAKVAGRDSGFSSSRRSSGAHSAPELDTGGHEAAEEAGAEAEVEDAGDGRVYVPAAPRSRSRGPVVAAAAGVTLALAAGAFFLFGGGASSRPRAASPTPASTTARGPAEPHHAATAGQGSTADAKAADEKLRAAILATDLGAQRRLLEEALALDSANAAAEKMLAKVKVKMAARAEAAAGAKQSADARGGGQAGAKARDAGRGPAAGRGAASAPTPGRVPPSGTTAPKAAASSRAPGRENQFPAPSSSGPGVEVTYEPRPKKNASSSPPNAPAASSGRNKKAGGKDLDLDF